MTAAPDTATATARASDAEGRSGFPADRRRVGWYIHHHGAGHITRFLAVRPHLAHEVTVFSSLHEPAALPAHTTWIELPRDDDPIETADGGTRRPGDADPTVGGILHWAPIGHPGHARRLALVAAQHAADPFASFVVDVSAEVTVFVRLLGIPPVVVTQPGDRSDAAHRLAYDLASRILAPWPAGRHDSPALDRLGDRVARVGGISRFDGRSRDADVVPGSVLVIAGSEDPLIADRVAAAQAATPGTTWSVIGAGSWVADPWAQLQRAEIVVAAAGQNSIADLAAARARSVVIPQDRPFDEQRATAHLLDQLDLAVVAPAWPSAAEWGDLLSAARALQPAWEAWAVDGAAQRAAATIHAEAVRWPR